MKIKVGDNILVTTGKDRGKTGAVLRTFKKKEKVIVEKINIRTKHIKKTQTRPGEKIRFEAALPASNIMIICPSCDKATRAGYLTAKDGKKQRICKKCNQSLENTELKKNTRSSK